MDKITTTSAKNSSIPAYDAFTCVGVELEYMVVDCKNYEPRGIVDVLFQRGAEENDDAKHDGTPIDELCFGPIGWSNELARHVLEFKTSVPASNWAPLVSHFQNEVTRANRLLAHEHASLLPGGVHPWMNPATQAQLWPYGQSDVYKAYDQIFGCSGHGWLNLQSMHINLPFRGDEQFRRLHSAIRLILPLVVALAASSPVLDEKLTGAMSERMRRYADNQRKIPEISGLIIPEVVRGISEYHERILDPMYKAIRPFDPQGTLQHEWLNSRGAIARFDRSAIEIRVADTQECPLADLSLAYFVNAFIQQLYHESFSSLQTQEDFGTQQLAAQLQACILEGRNAKVFEPGWARSLGGTGKERTLGELIGPAVDRCLRHGCPSSLEQAVVAFGKGPGLSERMISYIDVECSRSSLQALCGAMCKSLATGRFLDMMSH